MLRVTHLRVKNPPTAKSTGEGVEQCELGAAARSEKSAVECVTFNHRLLCGLDRMLLLLMCMKKKKIKRQLDRK